MEIIGRLTSHNQLQTSHVRSLSSPLSSVGSLKLISVAYASDLASIYLLSIAIGESDLCSPYPHTLLKYRCPHRGTMFPTELRSDRDVWEDIENVRWQVPDLNQRLQCVLDHKIELGTWLLQ